jgi:hypothetical protein
MPEIRPGNDIIHTLRNQKTEIQFALGEYIDNAIDSYFKYEKELKKSISDYKPFIDIEFDSHENTIIIEDNCAGIHEKDEVRAFKIGKQNPNEGDIGTYGMGMKVSSFWFCANWEVETKPLHENFKKTFKVDLQKILQTGKTEDSKAESDADPYTKITLKEAYQGRVPSDTRKINNIKNYLGEMYRFMIIEQDITIRFNGMPLIYEPPAIFKKRYFADKDGEDLYWLAKIPEFSLGTVNRGGKDVELKILGGGVYIKEKGTNKNQKGFSIFWKKRLVDGHPQKPWMPGKIEYDEVALQIYAAKNQYVAQRLEGYVHVSSKFNVPSTKDGIDWEELEVVFIRKLKKYLQNATLANDESGRTYDFIRQCKSIADLNRDSEEDLDITDEDILEDIAGEETIIISDPPEEETSTGENEDIFDGNARKYGVKYEDTKWIVEIKTVNLNQEKFYKIVDGPFGSPGDSERTVGLKINLGHPFIRYHFSQTDISEQREGIIKFCISLALGEAITAEKPGKQVRRIRLISNEILDIWGDRY